MRHFAIAALLVMAASSASAATPVCADDATKQAKKLLSFHMGEGFEKYMAFEAPKPKASLKNPANPKQIFQVLEVEGFVDPSGRYRMRFIYYPSPQSCLLMGQEILEIANL